MHRTLFICSSIFMRSKSFTAKVERLYWKLIGKSLMRNYTLDTTMVVLIRKEDLVADLIDHLISTQMNSYVFQLKSLF